MLRENVDGELLRLFDGHISLIDVGTENISLNGQPRIVNSCSQHLFIPPRWVHTDAETRPGSGHNSMTGKTRRTSHGPRNTKCPPITLFERRSLPPAPRAALPVREVASLRVRANAPPADDFAFH